MKKTDWKKIGEYIKISALITLLSVISLVLGLQILSAVGGAVTILFANVLPDPYFYILRSLILVALIVLGSHLIFRSKIKTYLKASLAVIPFGTAATIYAFGTAMLFLPVDKIVPNLWQNITWWILLAAFPVVSIWFVTKKRIAWEYLVTISVVSIITLYVFLFGSM